MRRSLSCLRNHWVVAQQGYVGVVTRYSYLWRVFLPMAWWTRRSIDRFYLYNLFLGGWVCWFYAYCLFSSWLKLSSSSSSGFYRLLRARIQRCDGYELLAWNIALWISQSHQSILFWNCCGSLMVKWRDWGSGRLLSLHLSRWCLIHFLFHTLLDRLYCFKLVNIQCLRLYVQVFGRRKLQFLSLVLFELNSLNGLAQI